MSIGGRTLRTAQAGGDGAAQPSELLLRTDLVQVGRFRCPPEHPRFRDSASPMKDWEFVFPRSSVRIAHAGGEAFVTDSNVVTFYNRGQEYVREPVSAEGDVCEWFSVDHSAVLETVARHDPRVLDRPDSPFPFTHGPSDPASFLAQRLLVLHAAREPEPDTLFVEETVLWILDRLVANRLEDAVGSEEPSRAERERIEQVRGTLAARFADRLALSDLAADAGCSVSHVCHVFRRVVGCGVHAYQTQLRLRHALELVAEGAEELTAIALDLGFSSHSHFTETFRRCFGTPPSRLRGRLTSDQVRALLRKAGQ